MKATNHPLHFEDLSPGDFERLCYWLADNLGFEDVEPYGLSGNDDGVDLEARRNGRRVFFQCKRYKTLGPKAAAQAVQEMLAEEAPDELILVAAARLSRDTRRRVRAVAGPDVWCGFWGRDELDKKIKDDPRAAWEFFQLGSPPAAIEPSSKSPAHSGVMMPPKRPPHYLERSEYLDKIKAALLADEGSAVGITATGRVGVQGMGGIGKTVLASATAEDPEIQAAFPDGVHWITVSQSPDLLRLLQELASELSDTAASLQLIHQSRRHVSKLLAQRRVLLVLDDVWTSEHVSALDVVGENGRLLITTRNRPVLTNIEAHEVNVELLPEDQALQFLARWARQRVEDLPDEARLVVKECGRLPLALAMIGAMVALAPTAWDVALTYLQSADLDQLERAFPEYPYRNLLKALEVSVEALPSADRERYIELAVFPEDSAIPKAAILTLWRAAGLTEPQAQHLLIRLSALSLLQETTEGRVTLHDLQGDYLRHQVIDLPALHKRLVDAYRQACPKGFAHGPDDGFFFQRLPFHLAEAGLEKQCLELLFDFSWLRSKLAATDINSLVADFRLPPNNAETQYLRGALRLSAHVLCQSPQQLTSQLWGRLPAKATSLLERLLVEARDLTTSPWLRPLHKTLTQPGGPELYTLEGHSGWVYAVEYLGDEKIISGSNDKTLRVWEAFSGRTLRILSGHTSTINSLAKVDEQRVVSACQDGTLRLWDISNGEHLRTLEGHTASVTAVASLGKGRLISASQDGTLRVWDADSGASLQILEGHMRPVNAVASLSKEGQVISASDCVLRVWNVFSGKCIQKLEGHAKLITAIAVLGDGRVVSASQDGTLRTWDLASGTTIQVLEGHTAEVLGVVSLGRGRVASASSDRTLRVWDALSGTALQKLEGHSGWVLSVADLGKNRVVSASNDRTLRVWQLAGRPTMPAPLSHTGSVVRVVFRGQSQVISASRDHTMRVWDLSSGRAVGSLKGHSDEVRSVAVSSSGKVASASSDGTLRVWDMSTGTSSQTLMGHTDWVFDLVWLGENRIVSASGDRTLRLWDILRGETIQIFEGHTRWVNAVASLDEGRIVSASLDGTCRVWDVETGQALQVLEGHSEWVFRVASLGQNQAISASGDCTLRVWDVARGQTLQILEGHRHEVLDVASLNTTHVVSASRDGTIRVWDISGAKTIATLSLDAPVYCVATLADSLLIAAGVQGGKVHLLGLENFSPWSHLIK